MSFSSTTMDHVGGRPGRGWLRALGARLFGAWGARRRPNRRDDAAADPDPDTDTEVVERMLEAAELEQRERERVARVLHDDIQQLLAAALLHLSLPDGHAQATSLLRTAVRETRALSHELAGGQAGEPLVPRLRTQVEHFRTRHRIEIACDLPDHLEVDELVTLVAVGAVRELLFNATRFPGIHVCLAADAGDGWISVRVSDDGPGLPAGTETAGLGLREVRRRVKAVGGWVDAFRPEGGGTCFTLCLPRQGHRPWAAQAPRDVSGARPAR